MRQWYVIRSKPHRERIVHQQLVRQGLDTFFPTARERATGPRAARETAYFPGYLFVRVDLEEVGVSRLRWVPAALGVLEFGGVAATVPDGFVQQLRRRLDEIRAAGGLAFDGLHPGDSVQIVSGPFAGYKALFDLRLKGAERVRVLLEMLHRRVAVELDAGDIRKVKQAPGGMGRRTPGSRPSG